MRVRARPGRSFDGSSVRARTRTSNVGNGPDGGPKRERESALGARSGLGVGAKRRTGEAGLVALSFSDTDPIRAPFRLLVGLLALPTLMVNLVQAVGFAQLPRSSCREGGLPRPRDPRVPQASPGCAVKRGGRKRQQTAPSLPPPWLTSASPPRKRPGGFGLQGVLVGSLRAAPPARVAGTAPPPLACVRAPSPEAPSLGAWRRQRRRQTGKRGDSGAMAEHRGQRSGIEAGRGRWRRR